MVAHVTLLLENSKHLFFLFDIDFMTVLSSG